MTILTERVARLLLLPILVVSVGLLLKGYAGAGDGFSAGVLAATGVLLQDIVFGFRKGERLVEPRLAYACAGVGLLVVVLFAVAPLFWGGPLLTHFPRPGEAVLHLGTLEVHTALLFDGGIFLLVFGFLIVVLSLIAEQAREDKP